jgi:hypothetical protein
MTDRYHVHSKRYTLLSSPSGGLSAAIGGLGMGELAMHVDGDGVRAHVDAAVLLQLLQAHVRRVHSLLDRRRLRERRVAPELAANLVPQAEPVLRRERRHRAEDVAVQAEDHGGCAGGACERTR